jgi:SPP1 gp7 family putative phage head morphogenesis protein
MSKRFAKIRGLIRKAVVQQDCFGLRPQRDIFGRVIAHQELPGERAFNFPTSQEKVQAFMVWLRAQVDAGILEVKISPEISGRPAIQEAWTNYYIQTSYEGGVIQARAKLTKAGYSLPDLEPSPAEIFSGTQYVLKDSLHMDRVGLLYIRTYNDLKGITNAMDLQVSRVLAQGMADGKWPIDIADLLNKTISGPMGTLAITDTLGRFIPAERRARMLARTEIIRAHSQATLMEYKRVGLEDVILQVELLPAGDACPECQALGGKPYKIEQVQNLIPVHPHCRCSFIPVIPKRIKI